MGSLMFGLVLAVIILGIAAARKWNSDNSLRYGGNREHLSAPEASAAPLRSGNTLSFSTKLDKAQARKSVIAYANQKNYDVEDMSSEDEVVLGESASLFTWGFFYPIYMYEHEARTQIEVGIQSKAVQVGPIKNKSHENFVNGLKAHFWMIEQD